MILRPFLIVPTSLSLSSHQILNENQQQKNGGLANHTNTNENTNVAQQVQYS